MNSITKKTIDALLEQNEKEDSVFGECVSSILFREENCALLIDVENKQCQLLNKNQSYKDFFYSLTEILATISYLEKEKLIYIQESYKQPDIQFFYEGKQFFKNTQIPNEFLVNEDGLKLIYIPSQKAILHTTEQLEGVLLPDSIFGEVTRVFSSYIYPTNGLVLYASRGYMTIERKIAERSLKVAWVAIFVTTVLQLFQFFLC